MTGYDCPFCIIHVHAWTIVPGGDHLKQNRIVINHVTYEVHRVYSGDASVANLIKERLRIRQEFPGPLPLTGQGAGKYNDGSGSILSEEVL